jgi:exopolysaccharide production protein ExoQ
MESGTTANTRHASAGDRLRSWWQENSLAVAAVALMLASDTKFRLREDLSAGGTSVDAFIMLEVLVYLLVVVLLIHQNLIRPTLAGVHPLVMLTFAFVSLLTLGALLTGFSVYGLVRSGQMIALFLLILAISQSRRAGDMLERTARVYVFACLGLVVVGVLLPSQRNSLQQDRFNWLATHSVSAGHMLAIGVVAAAALSIGYLFRYQQARLGVVFGFAALLLGVTLVANNTRGAAAAAAIGLALAALFLLPARLYSSALIVVGYTVLVVALTAAEPISKWITRQADPEELGSLNSRTDLWSVAIERTAAESPLFGFGTGSSRSIFYEDTGLGGGHNAAINVFADLGLVGLAVWLLILIWALLLVVRTRSRGKFVMEKGLWLGIFSCLAVGGITYEGIGATTNTAAIWLFLLIGSAAGAANGLWRNTDETRLISHTANQDTQS